MLESSGFRKHSTLLVIQVFFRRLCLCHCLCIRLCLCICVPNSFLNSYYHKLSENVWVWGSRGSRSGDLVGCHHGGTTTNQTRKDRATQPMDYGRLRWAITLCTYSFFATACNCCGHGLKEGIEIHWWKFILAAECFGPEGRWSSRYVPDLLGGVRL